MHFSAILWDMDGTLINSEPVHDKAFHATTRALGFELPPAVHASILGFSAVEVHQTLIELTGGDFSLAEWQRIKWQYYQQFSPDITLMPHTLSMLDYFSAQALPMALVSNSTRDEVDLNLRVTGLTPYFPLTISRDDVTRGKPAPDPYLAAAHSLNVQPARCVVVEDSVTGANAGLAAEMTTVFHPETSALVERCPDGAILLEPGGDLLALLQTLLPTQ